MAFDYERMGNVSDHNILCGMGEGFSLEEWQKSGLDANSTTIQLKVAIDPEDQLLEWSSTAGEVPEVTRNEVLENDYFGRPYASDEVSVGPFMEGLSEQGRRLRLTAG